jgi:hypothetical protein
MELWYPQAIRRPGPPGKVWPRANSIDGIVLHSMQGSLAGAYTVVDDEATNAQGAYLAASWTFSVAKSGVALRTTRSTRARSTRAARRRTSG